MNILDIGCGPGNFLHCQLNWYNGSNITGLDISEELLNYAKSYYSTCKFIRGSAEVLPFRRESFDIVSALQVIEHLYNPSAFLEEVYRILKPRGLFLLATPNPNGIAARLLKSKWTGFREDHIALRNPSDWHSAIECCGFSIIKEGTTLLNGLPVLRVSPLSLPLQIFQALFGFFPWQRGESYMVIARKIIC